MSRRQCSICCRETAGHDDWERNGELNDEEAKAAGLDDLCWEKGADSCLAVAVDLGRPTSYEEAMDSLFGGASLTDNPAAVEAAIAAFRRRACELTMLDLNQGPGEGNYDRIEQLRIEAAIQAAEAVGVDEQDTMVLKTTEGVAEDE